MSTFFEKGTPRKLLQEERRGRVQRQKLWKKHFLAVFFQKII